VAGAMVGASKQRQSRGRARPASSRPSSSKAPPPTRTTRRIRPVWRARAFPASKRGGIV
jgi:hypothetical protein